MKFFVVERGLPESPDEPLGGTNILMADGTQRGDCAHCPTCNYPLSPRIWLPPYRVELETWGKQFDDIIPESPDLVVSEKFLYLFQNGDLRGLSDFQPVEVVEILKRNAKPKGPPPDYFKATVVRSPTTVDQRASGYVWGDEPAICPSCLMRGDVKRFKRLLIKGETWNGDDIFFPRGGIRLIASERFKSLCEQNAIRGVVFTPSENYGYELRPEERKDWDIRQFDEVVAILQAENSDGRFDGVLHTMGMQRANLVEDREFNWLSELRRCFPVGVVDDVADVTSKAHRRLLRNP